MHGRVKNEKTSWLIFFVVFFGYVLVSMTKNTYSSAMSAIVQEGMVDKGAIGLINACFYLVYGSTQMLGGYLVDRISPFKLFAFGVLLSACCNAAMAIWPTYNVMLTAWSINGFAQFAIWPAVIKISATVIMSEHTKKVMTYLAFAYPMGSMLSYLVAAGVLKVATWPWLFWVASFAMLLVAPFLIYSEKRAKREIEPDVPCVQEKKEVKAEKKSGQSVWKLFLKSGIIFMTIPSLIRCMLDVGLKSWAPTMIMEKYSVSPSFATFITTILIIVNLFAIFIVNWLYPKRFKNAATATAILFVASTPLLILTVFTGEVHLAFIVLSLALVTTLMTAGSQFMNVIIPAVFSDEGRTGVVAGFINTFGAFGCMVSNYAYGYLAENFGWKITSIVWVVLCAISVVFCLLNAPFWKKYTAKQ
ncbi:MAG: MFS transporter [Oscillospiraceae bacterium]|nr:MFS transporter [Oscillospiraceae bacterium]